MLIRRRGIERDIWHKSRLLKPALPFALIGAVLAQTALAQVLISTPAKLRNRTLTLRDIVVTGSYAGSLEDRDQDEARGCLW